MRLQKLACTNRNRIRGINGSSRWHTTPKAELTLTHGCRCGQGQRIGDKTLLRLIRRYLESGLLKDGVVQNRREGTPQGGPLSPLLSNILLHELDKELEKRGHKFVRYADDCSIFLTSRRAAERVLASITRFLNRSLHLEVNEEKTSICRPVHFELLGHGFVSSYKKGDRGKYRLCIAKPSWKRLKEKIKIITRKTSPIPFEERIEQLNRLMYGWVNYFKQDRM